jgi:hypothetical protein
MNLPFGTVLRWYDKKPGGQRLVVMVIRPDNFLGEGRYRAMCLSDWAPGQSVGDIRSYPLTTYGRLRDGWEVRFND